MLKILRNLPLESLPNPFDARFQLAVFGILEERLQALSQAPHRTEIEREEVLLDERPDLLQLDLHLGPKLGLLLGYFVHLHEHLSDSHQRQPDAGFQDFRIGSLFHFLQEPEEDLFFARQVVLVLRVFQIKHQIRRAERALKNFLIPDGVRGCDPVPIAFLQG